jgi:hypothetical protein
MLSWFLSPAQAVEQNRAVKRTSIALMVYFILVF